MTNDNALRDRVIRELFPNLSHYRQHCISEGSDADRVVEFITALAGAISVAYAIEPPRWISAVPMVRRDNGNWSKVHYTADGMLGRDVTAEEADAVGAYQFHLLKPNSPEAIAALRSQDLKGGGK